MLCHVPWTLRSAGKSDHRGDTHRWAWLSSKKLNLWTLKCKVHMMFTCHKIKFHHPPQTIFEKESLLKKKKNVSTYLHLQSKLLTFSQSIGQCGVDTWPHLPVCLWSGHFSGSVSSSLKWGHGKDVWPGWLGCLSVNRLWSGWPKSTSAQAGPVLSTLAVTVEARCPLQRSPGTFSASG